MVIVAPLNNPVVAELLAVRVKLTSWNPAAGTETAPVEANVTPVGKPVPVITRV
jgi:hypothetical protein